MERPGQADRHGATQMRAPGAHSTGSRPQVSPLLELDARALALEAADASIDESTALSVDVIDLDEKLQHSSQPCGAQRSDVEISIGDSAHVSILTLLLEEEARHVILPGPTATTQGKMAAANNETRHNAKRPLEPNQCAYRNGQCKKPRTLKSNGALHSLCEQHRRRSLDNQMRFDQKQRVRRLCEQLQLQPDSAEDPVVMAPQQYSISHPTSDDTRLQKTESSSTQFPAEQDTPTQALVTAEASGVLNAQEDRPSKRMQVYHI